MGLRKRGFAVAWLSTSVSPAPPLPPHRQGRTGDGGIRNTSELRHMRTGYACRDGGLAPAGYPCRLLEWPRPRNLPVQSLHDRSWPAYAKPRCCRVDGGHHSGPHAMTTPSDTAREIALVRDALRFFVWAAGEGLSPAEDDVPEPETTLFEYAVATGNEDWDNYPDTVT